MKGRSSVKEDNSNKPTKTTKQRKLSLQSEEPPKQLIISKKIIGK